VSETRLWLLEVLGRPKETVLFKKDEKTGEVTEEVNQVMWVWPCGCMAFSWGKDKAVWHYSKHCRRHRDLRQP
jgi:hypothetical protein